jgi:hypothetical protein
LLTRTLLFLVQYAGKNYLPGGGLTYVSVTVYHSAINQLCHLFVLKACFGPFTKYTNFGNMGNFSGKYYMGVRD